MSAAAVVRQPRAPPFLDPPGYARHRPESTLLYQLVEQHYPAFSQLRVASGRPLPGYVEQEFEAYLECGRAGPTRSRGAGVPPSVRAWCKGS
ncbi:MAG: hypothetical protein OEW57_15845, partial [Gammaproteobacteria bacterium]|nr:hypothetical protein [Gammaproteobacteria bacterium]